MTTEPNVQEQKPDCYKCIYRRDQTGTYHSRCIHPLTPKEGADPMRELMAMFASVGRVNPVIDKAALELGIKANYHGIKNGWFNWPDNFDPIWLNECKGYTKEAKP